MTKKSNRANSAQNRTTKRVNNRCNSAEETCTAVVVENIEPQSQTYTAAVVNLPIATETETESESGKITSKEVLKAAGSLRAAVKEERRGANCTIRLIAERAAAGDTAAVDILCALCDVPRAALYSLNINIVRNAVNSYYPYYIESEGRRVSVKPVGVWYSTANENETQEDASKRVKRGYRAVEVVDYLDMLIKAAKSRAKGITPRCVDSNALYTDCKMTTAADGITSAEIDEAKERRTYSATAANVWRRDRNGFYI